MFEKRQNEMRGVAALVSHMFYVIKDQDGNYVSLRAFTLTDEGWLYLFYTGITTGFTSHTYIKTAEEDLTKLQLWNDKYSLGKKFHIEYIDVDSVEMGKSVIVELNMSKVLAIRTQIKNKCLNSLTLGYYYNIIIVIEIS